MGSRQPKEVTKIYHELYEISNKKELDNFNSYSAPYLLDYLPKNKNARVMDLGCGCGLLLGYLKRLGYQNIVGIDFVSEMIEGARKRLGSDTVLINIDILDYYDENKYDLILMFDILEHFEPSKGLTVLEKVKSLLKPDGSVIIRVPNAATVVSSSIRYLGPEHHTMFMPSGLDYMMLPLGFDYGKVIDTNKYKPLWIKSVIKARNFCYYLLYRLHELAVPPTFDSMITMAFKLKEAKKL